MEILCWCWILKNWKSNSEVFVTENNGKRVIVILFSLDLYFSWSRHSSDVGNLKWVHKIFIFLQIRISDDIKYQPLRIYVVELPQFVYNFRGVCRLRTGLLLNKGVDIWDVHLWKSSNFNRLTKKSCLITGINVYSKTILSKMIDLLVRWVIKGNTTCWYISRCLV